jgi:hypothetical protein
MKKFMDKINFRFTLLKARFPDLYQEAENKIAGGVVPKDVMADWLNELVCRRGMSGLAPINEPQTIKAGTVDVDIDLAKNIMDGLAD